MEFPINFLVSQTNLKKKPLFFSLFRNQQSEYWVLYELMYRLPLAVRSPPARRSLSWIQSLLIELWLLVTEVSTLSLIVLTTHTMVTTGILPLQGKIPMVEPGIEPGTSWLVVRSSDHQTTRLVFQRQLQFIMKPYSVSTMLHVSTLMGHHKVKGCYGR